MTNIILEKIGTVQVIELNRPEVLNALNGEMVGTLLSVLEKIAVSPDIEAVFIKGAGGKAFCAGGDIKAARLGVMAMREGRMKLQDIMQFFIAEYSLNQALYHFEKPLISFMNGITMGGGLPTV